MDHDAAAERAPRGLVAHDEAVAAQRQQRLGESDLAKRTFFGLDFVFGAEDDELAQPLGGAEMDAHALVILDALSRRRPDLEPRVETIGRHRKLFIADDVTALDGGFFEAGEIERDALPPAAGVDGTVVHLETTHAKRLVSRQRAHMSAA